jgi:peptidoglycan hydrolase-like protein with peptidoglycan-binding domain
VTVLDALLDSPLREAIFTEAKHKRGSKGTSQGGKFISNGASGGAVQTIQRKVGATVDGAFGYNTRASVIAYQRAHGLQADGVVGHQTAAAMLGHSNAKNVKPGALTAEDRKHFGGNSKSSAKPSKRKGTAPARKPKPETARGRASRTSKTAGGISY